MWALHLQFAWNSAIASGTLSQQINPLGSSGKQDSKDWVLHPASGAELSRGNLSDICMLAHCYWLSEDCPHGTCPMQPSLTPSAA